MSTEGKSYSGVANVIDYLYWLQVSHILQTLENPFQKEKQRWWSEDGCKSMKHSGRWHAKRKRRTMMINKTEKMNLGGI